MSKKHPTTHSYSADIEWWKLKQARRDSIITGWAIVFCVWNVIGLVPGLVHLTGTNPSTIGEFLNTVTISSIMCPAIGLFHLALLCGLSWTMYKFIKLCQDTWLTFFTFHK